MEVLKTYQKRRLFSARFTHASNNLKSHTSSQIQFQQKALDCDKIIILYLSYFIYYIFLNKK